MLLLMGIDCIGKEIGSALIAGVYVVARTVTQVSGKLADVDTPSGPFVGYPGPVVGVSGPALD